MSTDIDRGRVGHSGNESGSESGNELNVLNWTVNLKLSNMQERSNRKRFHQETEGLFTQSTSVYLTTRLLL